MPRISPDPRRTVFTCPLDQLVCSPILGEPPVGAPVDFWACVAAALKTTDPGVLRAAAGVFVGVYESEHAYIMGQVADHLRQPDMKWLLACCDPVMLREGYEGRALVVWSIALADGGCMVFESVREPCAVLRAVLGPALAGDA